jgi:hypothetical protein
MGTQAVEKEHLWVADGSIANKREKQSEAVRYRNLVANYIKQVMEKLKLILCFGGNYRLLLAAYEDSDSINNRP